MAIIKKPTKTNAGEGVEKRELSCTVGGNVSWCSHYGKQYEVPQKTKNRTAIWSSNPTPGHRSRRNSNSERTRAPLCSLQQFTIRDMETTWMCIDRWVDEGYIGCIFSHFLSILCSISVQFSSVQFSSVAQSCLTLCDPMNHSTLGLPVHHQLPEFTQTHVHWVGDAIQPSHPVLCTSPPAFNLSHNQFFFFFFP